MGLPLSASEDLFDNHPSVFSSTWRKFTRGQENGFYDHSNLKTRIYAIYRAYGVNSSARLLVRPLPPHLHVQNGFLAQKSLAGC